MRTIKGSLLSGGAGVVLVLSASAPAAAQDVLTEEIVVTAQKREQSAQDVGIAMSTFGGEQLVQVGVQDSVDIARFSPGVAITGSYGGQMQQFTIRGVTQNDFNDHSEAPIAVYIDDVYIAAQQGQKFGLFDVSRVEVLKGPQGTLFGRNATGGLVQYVSRRPSKELEGYVRASYGTFNEVNLEAAIGGPLSDTVRARVSGKLSRQDGFLKNDYPERTYLPSGVVRSLDPSAYPGGGADLGGFRSWAARAQLEFDIGPDTTLLLSGSHEFTRLSTGPYTSIPTIAVLDSAGRQINTLIASPTETREAIGPGGVAAPGLFDPDSDNFRPVPGASFFGYKDPASKEWRASIDNAFDDFGFTRTTLLQAQLTAKLGNWNLHSITGFNQFKKKLGLDLDVSPIDFYNWIQRSKTSQFSQELRADTSFGGVKLVSGLYYLHIRNDALSGLTASNGCVCGFGFDQPRIIGLTTNSYSAFTQAEFEVSPKLTAIVGLRGGWDRQKYDFEVRLITPNRNPFDWETSPAVAFPGFFRLPYRDQRSNFLWQGKLQLNYTPHNDLLVYASATRGVKGGGYNAGGADLTDAEIPYRPEVLYSYEVGAKLSIPAVKGRVNVSAFYYDYRDYQASRWVGFANLITNNDAIIKGVDLDAAMQPLPGLEIQGTMSYTDGKVKDVVISGAFTRDVEPTYTPKWTASTIVRYTPPVSLAGGRVTLQGDMSYKGAIWDNLTNFDASRLPSYTLFGARLQWQSDNDRLLFAGWVKNLTDVRYSPITFDFAQICGCNIRSPGMPRTFGASAELRF